MTHAELRAIVAHAAKGFDEAAIEAAYRAAVAVRRSDDLHAYAREVGAAVARVLEAAVQREREITTLLAAPITRWH